MTTCNELQHFLAPARWDSQQQHETDVYGNNHRLLKVLSLDTGIDDDAATWGITIVRTDYKVPREHVLDALACINHAVQADLGATRSYPHRRSGIIHGKLAEKENCWPPLHGKQKQKAAVKPADELFARYSTELLSTYDGLNEADTDTVRRNFQSWIMKVQGNPHGGDMRYVFCIVLDADAIQQLHDVWSGGGRRSRVAAAAAARVRVLDAMPGEECRGAYEVRLRGEYGLVNFWFARSARRQPLEAMLTRQQPREEEVEGAMWCFGPPEVVGVEAPGKGKTRRGKGGKKGRGLKKDGRK